MRITRTLRGTLLAGLSLTLGLVLAACAPAGPAPAIATPGAALSGATRTSEGGQVTVKVTWLGQSAGPAFAVTLDTHAVDLDGYDLATLAVLRTDDGRQVQPRSWDAPMGGHHREGKLIFPATTPDGQPVIGPATRGIELIVRDVANVPERSFTWTL